jgi:hypothetical protein
MRQLPEKTALLEAAVAALRGYSLRKNAIKADAVVATFPTAPPAAELVVGVVGINFYQQINGNYYALNDSSTNPLATAGRSYRPTPTNGPGTL